MSFESLILEYNNRKNQEGWFPPDWNFNGYDITMNLRMARTIRDKKKSLHSLEEKKILKNEKIIRSCYTTPRKELTIAKFFIGLFDLDPFYNPYAITAEFGSENFEYFDGNNADGFNIDLWEKLNPNSIWENPPFNRLKEAAEKTDEYLQRGNDTAIAFICNLDRTSYFDRFLEIADYLIVLNRVKFDPIPGLEVSQPTTSNAMFIFNSKKDLPTCNLTIEGTTYLCINLKERETIEIAID